MHTHEEVQVDVTAVTSGGKGVAHNTGFATARKVNLQLARTTVLPRHGHLSTVSMLLFFACCSLRACNFTC
jgi:hypothetical protein